MTTFTLSDGTLITVVEWRFVPEGYNERPWTRFVLDDTVTEPPAREGWPPPTIDGPEVRVPPVFIEQWAALLLQRYAAYRRLFGKDERTEHAMRRLRSVDQPILAQVEVE